MDERCAYCGATDRVLTVDHVVPASRLRELRARGIAVPSVKVRACYECNALKGDLWPWEWHEFRATGEIPAHRNSARASAWTLNRAIRKRLHRSGHCDECGGKAPLHFARCTSLDARRNDAWGVPAMA